MRIGIDVEVDNETEAEKMMAYHLKLACAYFECSHDDRGLRANAEIRRVMDKHWADAASAFIDVLCSTYENMDA